MTDHIPTVAVEEPTTTSCAGTPAANQQLQVSLKAQKVINNSTLICSAYSLTVTQWRALAKMIINAARQQLRCTVQSMTMQRHQLQHLSYRES